MGDVIETRQNELKMKKICRFCLSQNEATLSSIFSRDSGAKNPPLPLQVMACVSIEVFSDECMPGFVCNECRLMLDYCYRFKQMCKKADTCLRHYPLTGIWSPPMIKPKLNWNAAHTPVTKAANIVVQKVEDEDETSDTILTMMSEIQSYLQDESEQQGQQDQVTELVEEEQEEPVKSKPPSPKPVRKAPQKPSHKLLNKSVIRILNKEAQNQTDVEPRMTKPRLKRDEDGNLAIVTEILDPDMVLETNPVENATVIETNVFPCPHCERSFPLRQLLDIHMVNHNRERSFNCNNCDKSFFSKYDLQKHMLVHTGEKPFKCVVCGKGFTRSTLLHRHEKIHTDIPKFICVFCEKPFISQEEMEKHTERHRKNRPFTCKICNKSFAFKQGLERHEVVHCRFQPYQCQYCDQSFSTPSKLSRHLTAHAGARPYPCKLCPKAYLLSHHLTRHLRSHKNGSSSFKCNDCDKTFTHRDDLIYHSAVHATQTLICPLCKDVLDDVEAVTEHVKQHADGESYACEFCDLIFMTANRLQDHTDSEHVEEMVAYNEEEKLNPQKDEKSKEEKSSDINSREVEEVIEEFLYEEFSDAGQNKASVAIKEEVEWQGQSNSNNSIDEEDNSASESVDYMNIIERSESIDGPPAKVTKLNETKKQVTKKASPAPVLLRHKPATKSPVASTPVHSRASQPKENKKPTPKPAAESRLKSEAQTPSPAPKTRQPTIQAALQGLPRSLSIKKVGGDNKPIESAKKPTQSKETEAPKVSPKAAPPIGTIIKQIPQQGRPLRQRPEIKKTPPKSPAELVVNKSPSSASKAPVTDKKIVEMMIGDKRVKVQKITMTKAQAVAMAREGRIQMKEGTMILKKNLNQTIKLVNKSN